MPRIKSKTVKNKMIREHNALILKQQIMVVKSENDMKAHAALTERIIAKAAKIKDL